MGAPVKVDGTGGRIQQFAGEILQGSGTGGANIWVGGMGDAPLH